MLNTSWATQGVASEIGTAHLDMRYEFVDQSHLRSGNREITQAEDTSDTTELRTINRNLVTTLDYTFSRNWAGSLALPAVSRSHSHIVDPTGVATVESWDFTKPGDIRLLGMYRFENEGNPLVNYGLIFGLKLPTGEFQVKNSEGAAAERMLQPGTGTTDAVVGAYYSAPGSVPDSTWSVQILAQQAMDSRDDYRPGDQYQLNLGYRHPLEHDVQALLQLNSLVRERDSGANAEPDLSGSKTVFLSPGLAYSVTRNMQAYSFVQVPIYRYVNGVQLSANWAFVAGLTTRF